MERPDLGCSPALRAAYEAAIGRAGVSAEAIRHLDLYSCFPIAVFLAREALGIAPDDPRPLTMTGGLPSFGGPGNNYSMHALAAMAPALRADRAAFGLDGAEPAPWIAAAQGEAVVETYTVAWRRGAPVRAPAVARLKGTGIRCLAATAQGDTAAAREMAESDPLGATIRVTPAERGHRFTF
jgi:acetyl-CoA C-acetyltransferase